MPLRFPWSRRDERPGPVERQAPVEQPWSPEESIPRGVRIAAAWSWRSLVVLGLIGVVIWLVIQLRYIVIPLLVAVLLAALLVPLSAWLQRRGWPKWAGVAVSMLALLGIVSGLVYLVVWQILRGRQDLADQSLEAYEQFKVFLRDSALGVDERELEQLITQAWEQVQQDSQVLVSGALSVGSSAGHFLAGLLLTLFATLFILIDGRLIWNWIVRLFPEKARSAMVGGGQAGWLTLTTFVKVQIFVAAVDAVGIGLGAWILGLFFPGGFPLVIPIAVLVFLGSFIPIVGAVLTGALAVLVALIFLGPIPALIMLGIVLLVQQLEGHVLQPFIMGAAVRVHPLAVVLAVATGGFVAGIAGALFAVPIVAVLNVVVGYIARGEWRTNPHPSVADVTTRLPRPGGRR